MFDMTDNDLFEVYNQLKNRYDLILTTTSALNRECDAGFTIECPILVGKAHGQIIELYVCDEMFVMDVMNDTQTKGTHWHPCSVKAAVKDIVDFMNGTCNYKMQPFSQT